MMLLDSPKAREEAENQGLYELTEIDKEELRIIVEKRADLLAGTLQTIIGVRQKQDKSSARSGMYKNDPFRNNKSHNSLLQLARAGTIHPNAMENSSDLQMKQLADLHEIRQRLIEKGMS